MKNPGLQLKLIRSLAAALFVAAGPGFAQPPETAPNKRTNAKSRPQVIYHLPSSSSAATLHSQAKGPNTEAPSENGNSRQNPNPSPPQARLEAVAAPPQESHPKARSQPQMKRSKTTTVRSARPPSTKAKGSGSGGPKKSHKK
jgi:hypothetical protein